MNVRVVLLCLLFASSLAQGKAAEQYSLNIQYQTIEQALHSLARASSRQLLFPYDQMEDVTRVSVSGLYTLKEALSIILKGTSLSGELTAEGVILVTLNQKKSDRGSDMNAKKNILASTIAFFVGSGAQTVVAQDQSNVSQQAGQDWLLEEVIVTATKRETSLQDTAMSISVVGGDEIERKSLVSMSDYLASVPGVSMIDRGTGANQIIIRGIGLNQFEQAAVSAYFGEIPLTSPVGVGSSSDMKMVDLQRVEILRGPQGTLYGSGAMGGTVRNIPNSPNLNEFDANIDLGYGAVDGSNDNNNKIVGVINLPLVDDTLALRAVAYRFESAGVVDSVSSPSAEALAASVGATVSTKKDVDSHTYTGGRATLLWQASDQLNLSLMAATQKLEEEGDDRLNLLDGAYTQTSFNVPAPLFSKDEFDLVSLSVDYELNWATLVATYSHFEGNFERQDDVVTANLGFAGVVQNNLEEKEGDTFELRFSTELEGSIQFVGGIYYEDFELQDSLTGEWYGDPALATFGFNGNTGANGLPIVYEFPLKREQTLEQKAIFGELTYTLTPQWAVTAGARRFDYDRVDIEQEKFFGIPFDGSNVDSSEQGTVFKTNITYTPNDDALAYLQWSEGFRVGRGQVVPPASICDVEDVNGNPGADGILDGTTAKLVDSVGSDSTTNIELGGKFSLLDNRVTLNTAIYRVEWEDIPVRLFGACGLSVDNNAGKARSQGIELETRFHVTPNLGLSLALAYMETEFLDDTVAPGAKGERLPLAPRTNGVVGVDYNFELLGYEAFWRADYSYVGSFESAPAGNLAIVDAESHGKLNMRVGVDVDQWSLAVYGNNLTNEDAISLGFNTLVGRRVTPRTIGFEVGYAF